MSQVLQLAGVNRTYGEGATSIAALRDVNVTIDAGEFVAVVGPPVPGNLPSWPSPAGWTLRRRAKPSLKARP